MKWLISILVLFVSNVFVANDNYAEAMDQNAGIELRVDVDVGIVNTNYENFIAKTCFDLIILEASPAHVATPMFLQSNTQWTTVNLDDKIAIHKSLTDEGAMFWTKIPTIDTYFEYYITEINYNTTTRYS